MRVELVLSVFTTVQQPHLSKTGTVTKICSLPLFNTLWRSRNARMRDAQLWSGEKFTFFLYTASGGCNLSKGWWHNRAGERTTTHMAQRRMTQRRISEPVKDDEWLTWRTLKRMSFENNVFWISGSSNCYRNKCFTHHVELVLICACATISSTGDTASRIKRILASPSI
jgi:hypothetical protein